jgi:hypothetical protein
VAQIATEQTENGFVSASSSSVVMLVGCDIGQAEVLGQADSWPFDRARIIRADPSPEIAVPEDVNALASFFCRDPYVRFSHPDSRDRP